MSYRNKSHWTIPGGREIQDYVALDPNVFWQTADKFAVNTSFHQNFQSAIMNLPADSSGGGQKQTIACLFESMDGARLTLECQGQPPLSAALSVEYNDAMFLGEIVAVAPLPHGRWRAEIRVEQVLTGLQSLMSLREALLGEGVGPRPARSNSLAGVYA